MRPFRGPLLPLVIALGVLCSNARRPGVRRKLTNVFASPVKLAAHNYWYSQQKLVSKKQNGSVKGNYKKLQPKKHEYHTSNAFEKTKKIKKVVQVVQLEHIRKEPWWKAEPPSPPAKGVSKGKEYPNIEDYFWWQDDAKGKGKGVVVPQRPPRPSRPPTRAPYAGLFPTLPPDATIAPVPVATISPIYTEPTTNPTSQPSATSSTVFPTPELSLTLDPTTTGSSTELPTITSSERSQAPSSLPEEDDIPTLLPSPTSATAIPSEAQQDSFQPSTSNTEQKSAPPTPGGSPQPSSSNTEPAASPLPTPGGTQQPTTVNTQVPTTDPDLVSAMPTPTGSLLTALPTPPSSLQSGPPTSFETIPPALSTNPPTPGGTQQSVSVAPTPGGSPQPSSSNTDTTLSTVNPEVSVVPTPGESAQPGSSNTEEPVSTTTEPAASPLPTPGGTSDSQQPGQATTNEPVATSLPTSISLLSALPTPPGSLLTASPTPPGSLQSGPPTVSPALSTNPTPGGTQQPTALTLVIENIPIEAGLPSEGSTGIDTDAPGMNVQSTPFVVDYITKGEPSQDDIRAAQSITYSYLSDYLSSQMFQNPSISFIGESVTAVRTTTTASAIRMEYEFVGIFSEESKVVPSMSDLDRKILLAFSQPAVQTLTLALHDLPKDNPFSETSDVSFVISNVPPLIHTKSEPPPQEAEDEVFSISTLGLAMLGIFLGVAGLALILMRRRRRRRYKDLCLHDVTSIQERIHANGNNDTTVRQHNTISVARGGGDDADVGAAASALLHHTVPSASTASIPTSTYAASIPMSTNSAFIQGERQISNEQSAAFLLPINNQHHDGKTSDFNSLSKDSSASDSNSSEDSFPPTATREIDRDYSTWVQKTYSQRGYSEVKSDDD